MAALEILSFVANMVTFPPCGIRDELQTWVSVLMASLDSARLPSEGRLLHTGARF